MDIDGGGGPVLYRGNNFSVEVSQTGGTADLANNVESVWLPAGTTGSFTVTVRASNIAGDGVPNIGDNFDQDFALVVYNGANIVCGDGIIDGTEVCDDGGTVPGDGCDGVCQLELGWNCTGAPSVCSEVCGDDMVVGGEVCDGTAADICPLGCAVDCTCAAPLPSGPVARWPGPRRPCDGSGRAGDARHRAPARAA